MRSKNAFSRSDVTAIAMKMASQPTNPASKRDGPNAPSSPVAAKVMRDVGVSREKMQQAYSFAKKNLAAK